MHRVALLFHASKSYDREVIAGIGSYVNQTRVAWDLFLEEDFRFRLDGIEDWDGDGIIADFDDPEVCKALSTMKLPIVAVGGSYEDQTRYPKDVAYVATDNRRLVELAFEHLVESGLTRFACYSLPESPLNRWAQEREGAFLRLMHGLHLPGQVHRGLATSAPTWNSAAHQADRLAGGAAQAHRHHCRHRRTRPAGDAGLHHGGHLGAGRSGDRRHRQRHSGTAFDAHPVDLGQPGHPRDGTRCRASDAPDAGRRAGAGRARRGAPGRHPAARVEPSRSPHGPRVMRALQFIRQYACQGIKTEQVAAYLRLSRSSLEACFRKELGRSVHDEIMAYKLSRAQALLEDAQLPASEVARQAGFGTRSVLEHRLQARTRLHAG